MSIAKVAGSQLRGELGAHRRALTQTEQGEEVNLRVRNRIADRRFVASFADSRYVVDSDVPLSVGQTVKATVGAIGGVVELKYLGAGQFEPASAQPMDDSTRPDSVGNAAVLTLQAKYRMSLTPLEQRIAAAASDSVAHAATMAMGALYLSRLGQPMQPQALQALYTKQQWKADQSQAGGGAMDLSALVRSVQHGGGEDLAMLSRLLGDAVEQAANGATAAANSAANRSMASALLTAGGGLGAQPQPDSNGARGATDDSLQRLASHLLNRQDTGTLAYHFGSLPVIVANQLVELDLVLFKEREPAGRPQGMRKLVMTLRTDTLGKVEVVAQSLDTHLSVSIATQSADATGSLSSHAQEIRDLLARLGWNVDSVAYRMTTEAHTAAAQVVRHVVSAGSLDAVV